MCWICKGLLTKGNYVSQAISVACNHGTKCSCAFISASERLNLSHGTGVWEGWLAVYRRPVDPVHLLPGRPDSTSGLELVTLAEACTEVAARALSPGAKLWNGMSKIVAMITIFV